MKKEQGEKPDDKAKKRLSHFESARIPQVTEDELLENLDHLIEELLAKGEPLTNQAAHKLIQFKNSLYHLKKEDSKNKKSEH